ncbi:MAG: ABC transporter ATP-binding protein [Spirochaetia bacterium]|jgi:iron(III) transport system ATP-binding protein|nr:ABC transporter ATP-binding protein [Spirochaetia bacterium]
MSNKSVRLENITKEYISPNKKIFKAVDHISLEISEGEFVTLLGPSGCGKTTTLRMIAGFETPTAGRIYIGNTEINSLTPDKRNTAMVFQSYALFPHYDVFNNISYGLRLKKLGAEEISAKVHGIISLVGLEGLETRFPNQLSGGQQQRVALARALVMEPAVMLFDEPLSNLDAKLRVSMRNEIRKIQQRLGVTSIYVTHDQSEAMSLSDRIIIMNNGNIEQVGTPVEVYKEPSSKFVANFIGKANFIPATVIKKITEDKVLVSFFNTTETVRADVKKTYQPGDQVDLLIRPESIEIDSQGKFLGKVSVSTFMGNLQEYFLEIGGITLDVEQTNPDTDHMVKAGEEIRFAIKAANFHIV